MLHKCRAGVAVLVFAGAGEVLAQEAILRGTVISDRGEVVQVATVQLVQLGMQGITGADGKYTMRVPAARVRGQQVTLRVQAIGHKPQSRVITVAAGDHTFDFTMVTDVNLLDAVIITGTQEGMSAKNVPFAVTRIDASAMRVAASDPLKQLQGKVPANIVSASGRPGAQPAVLLRGPTSINAQGRSQDPLYIVDGVIINGDLPELNPLDIESIEVLKGAAGASLYGARAGNGVINITTKSGRRALEGVSFHVRSEAGSQDIERDFGLARFHALAMDETGQRFCAAVSGQPFCARTFNYLAEQARINNAPGDFAANPNFAFPVDPGSTIQDAGLLRQRYQNLPWPGTSYNAVNQVVQPHPYSQNSVDLTGRLGGTRFYTSASNLTEAGAIRFLDGFRRNTFRVNIDQVIGTQWNIQLRSQYSKTSADGLNQEGGTVSNAPAFFRLTRVPAIVNVEARDTFGNLFIRPNLQGGGSQNENPLYSLENSKRSDVTNRFIGGLTVQYTPVSWFDLESTVGYDLRRVSFAQINDKGFRTTTVNSAVNNGNIFRGAGGAEAVDVSVNASVRKDLTPDLRARSSLRYLFEQRDFEFSTGQGNFLSVKGVTSLGNATGAKTLASSFARQRQIGLFAGGGMEYLDRYILDALIRRDGSSLFGAGNRWATFGRVSTAWRVAEEPWWFLPQVSELKLRGSYGTAGGSPNFTAQYETFNVGNGGILTLNVLGNRDLKPETHREIEIGADMEVLERFGLRATYARSRIDNQILPVPLSSSTGYAEQWQNAGSLLNITYELELNLPLVSRPDLVWTMSVVYDRNRTWVHSLSVPPFFTGHGGQQGAGSIFQIRPGERFGTFYGRKFLTSCGELPAGFQSDCGGPTSSFQRNDEGFLVWVGSGNNPRMGITHNLWETSLSASSAPWNVALNWGMPIILRGDANGIENAQTVALGNALPDFRFAITQQVQWRRLTLYALLDASIGQDVWNEGFHWAHLDFLSKDVDQAGKSVETAKPIGYYFRAGPPDGTGIGGFYDILGPNSFTVESASYAKLRELMLAYRLGPLGGFGDWEVSVVGRNVFTITGYRGFDPEVGLPGGDTGSAAINAVDAFTFPNPRSLTVGLSTTF